jgi:membrane-bound ClpP family serine protease
MVDTVQIASILIMVQALFIPGWADAQPEPISTKNVYVVEVTGEGSGGKQSTIAEVEQQAKQDAMRQAVEQAGVYLETNTQVDMARLSKWTLSSSGAGIQFIM